MADKDVERNVRSTTVEGIPTPTQRHVQGLGEKHAITFGEKSEARKTREGLLEKFRHREMKRKAPTDEGPAKRENIEPGDGGGEDAPE